jgi:UDP-N-acetylglucosamine pyrophosphorylase
MDNERFLFEIKKTKIILQYFTTNQIRIHLVRAVFLLNRSLAALAY